MTFLYVSLIAKHIYYSFKSEITIDLTHSPSHHAYAFEHPSEEMAALQARPQR
jgi:hypothetical protein